MHHHLLTALLLLPIGVLGREFVPLDFDGEVSIEAPRHWTVLDENMKNHLNTLSEAVVRIAGLPQSANDNIILIAANAHTSLPSPSATMRLSIRRGNVPSQTEIRELDSLPPDELAQAFQPAAEQTRKMMLSIEGISSAKLVDTRVVKNKSLFCIYVEFETDSIAGTSMSKTYLCPISTKSIKLSTSYRKSEAPLFQPILEHVWQSLHAQ
jgi:hypothetical protein